MDKTDLINEAMNEVVDTLKHADNEATDSPYWLILDPSQNMQRDPAYLAAEITGPFFCREDAEDHLKSRRYAFSDRAVVYCNSGFRSKKYKQLCRAIRLTEG